MKSIHEKRSEPRHSAGQYSSVEMTVGNSVLIYQFKIRNISEHGMCVLVGEGSEILKHLNVGDLLDMKYYPTDRSVSSEILKTEIRYITQADEARFQGHFFVGLLIIKS